MKRLDIIPLSLGVKQKECLTGMSLNSSIHTFLKDVTFLNRFPTLMTSH